MKKEKIILPVLILLMMLLQGCDKLIDNWEEEYDRNSIYGSGNLVEINLDHQDFNKLVLTHVYSANVRQGDEYSITLKVDDNIEPFISVYKMGDKLYFTLDNDNNYREVTLELDIVMPDIEKLELSGATYVMLEGFSFDHSLYAEISGASAVMGDIDVSDLYADLSGASSIFLTGSTEILDITLSGACYADLIDFAGINGYVSMSGVTNGKVNLSETLRVQLSGTSQLMYRGNPDIHIVEISGLAKLIRI